MLTRDGVAASLALALLTATACSACKRPGPPPPVEVVQGIHVVRLPQTSGDRESPLVVALHGRGGSPDSFASYWTGSGFEVVVPRGFDNQGLGYAWFDWPGGLSEEELGERLIAAADRLWPAIAQLAAGRRVIVTGFSQGGMLAFALAARHPEAVAHALPIAGAAPRQVLVPGRIPAPVTALHGTDDRVIPIRLDRTTVIAFKEHGGIAELREFPGVGHTLTEEIREDVLAHLRSIAATLRARDAGAR